jgi:hypothetical protein
VDEEYMRHWKVRKFTAPSLLCTLLRIMMWLNGPGDNIGLVSAKLPATCIRGHFYGIAAAVGKIGALSGAYAFEDASYPSVSSLIVDY